MTDIFSTSEILKAMVVVLPLVLIFAFVFFMLKAVKDMIFQVIAEILSLPFVKPAILATTVIFFVSKVW